MRSLALKLTLAFLLLGLVVIVLVGVLIWQFSATAFDRYLWEQARVVLVIGMDHHNDVGPSAKRLRVTRLLIGAIAVVQVVSVLI